MSAVPVPPLPLAPAPPTLAPLRSPLASRHRRSPLARRLAPLTPSDAEPCDLHETLEIGRQTLAACGAAGVWVLELGASSGDRLVARRSVAGRAVGLFARNGRVWVEVETRSAQPLDELAPERPRGAPSDARSSAPLPLAPEPSGERAVPARDPTARVPVAIAIVGHVVSAHDGRLVVDLGGVHGVRVGSHIELARRSESPLVTLPEREMLAVANVVAISEEQSLVELGVGEEVPIGAEAVLTSRELTSSRAMPPRASGVSSIAAVLRPFLVLGQLGFGALNDVAIGYRSRGPLRYQLLASPLAVSRAGDGTLLPAVALGLVSFDVRLLEIGVGLGAQTVNDSEHEPGAGLGLSQSLRFGAHDGLHVSIRNDVSLFHGEFAYSAFNGEAQVPVIDRGWLVLQGGGGRVGYWFFELGGKLLVLGNGTPGSLFLRGTIGYAALFESAGRSAPARVEREDVDHAGPLVGFGVEWRP